MRSALSAAIVLCLAVGYGSSAGAAGDEADRHARVAAAHFRGRRYDAAATEYRLAIGAGATPVTFFNLGEAERLAGHPDQALRAFQAFVRLSPHSPMRAAARGRITQLKAKIARRPVAPVEPDSDVGWNALVKAAEASAAAEEEEAKEKAAKEEAAKARLAAPPAPSTAEKKPAPPSLALPASAVPMEHAAPALFAPTGRGSRRSRIEEVSGAALIVAGAALIGGGVGFAVAAARKSREVEQSARFDPSTDAAGHGYSVAAGVLSAVGLTALIIGGALFEDHFLRGRERDRPTTVTAARRGDLAWSF